MGKTVLIAPSIMNALFQVFSGVVNWSRVSIGRSFREEGEEEEGGGVGGEEEEEEKDLLS